MAQAYLGQYRAPYVHRRGHDDHEGTHRLQQQGHDNPNTYLGGHDVWRRRDEPKHRDTPYDRPPLAGPPQQASRAGYGLPTLQLRYAGQPMQPGYSPPRTAVTHLVQGYGQPKAHDCPGQLIAMALGQVPVAHEAQLAAGKGDHSQLSPQQLSRSISQAPSTHEVFRLFEGHGAIFNHIHAANSWNKLSKLRDASERHEAQIRRLLQHTLELNSACGARERARIVHGIAKCKLRKGLLSEVTLLFSAVAEACQSSGPRGFKPQDLVTPQNLAMTVWAFAKA
eukprot:3836455-Prymnesium_polylepis.1